MKKIIKFIKDFLVLREEDKLHMLPWEMMKWIVSTPTAYKYKGMMRIPHGQRWNWIQIGKSLEDGKSPVKQAKQSKL